MAEISCAKIADEAPLEKVCLFGCGVSTGLGAVFNTCKVEANSSVAVFGVGCVGLAVVQAARMSGANPIIVVDLNPDKFDAARALGATHFINPNDLDESVSVQKYIAGTLTPWGVDYSFDCTGNTKVMRAALECAHRGMSCVMCGRNRKDFRFWLNRIPSVYGLKLDWKVFAFVASGVPVSHQYHRTCLGS